MPYPNQIGVLNDYSAHEQAQGNGLLPGQELDDDLAEVREKFNALNTFLRNVTRSDGRLKNRIVTQEALAEDVIIGLNAPVPWATGTAYGVAETVFTNNAFYAATVAHTSAASFETDLNAGRWDLLVDFAAIANANSETLAARVAAEAARDAAETARDGAETAEANLGAILEDVGDYIAPAGSTPPSNPVEGMIWFDGTVLRVYDGGNFVPAVTASIGGMRFEEGTFGADPDGVIAVSGGFDFTMVWINGALIRETDDYTVSGDEITITSPTENDEYFVWAYKALDATDYYTKDEIDTLFGPAVVYATNSAVEGAGVDEDFDMIRTAGHTAVGDGGGAVYKRVEDEPSHPGKLQSNDGAHWELVGPAVTLATFGGDAEDLEAYLAALVTADGNDMALHAPYVLPTFRGLKISEFMVDKSADADNQAGFEAALNALFNNSGRYVGLDLEGHVIGLSAPVDVADVAGLTGEGSDVANCKQICNGHLRGVGAFPDARGEHFAKTVTRTAGATTATVSDATGIVVGTHILPSYHVDNSDTDLGSLAAAGVPVGMVVTGVSGTTITTNLAWGTSGSGNARFVNPYYLLDFMNFADDARVWRLQLDNIDFRPGLGRGAVRLPQNSFQSRITYCDFTLFTGYAIDGLLETAAALRIDSCNFTAQGGDGDNPYTRNGIGIGLGGDDAVIVNCNQGYGRHLAVLNGGGYMIDNCHPWHGNGGASRPNTTPCLVFNLNAPRSLVKGCYLDNGFIEVTDARYSSSRPWLGSLSITNSRFDNNSDGSDFGFIDFNPKVETLPVEHLTVTGNLFTNRVPANTDVDATRGNAKVDTSAFKDVYFRDNGFENTNGAYNPLTVEATDGGAQTIHKISVAGLFPFDAQPKSATAATAYYSAPESAWRVHNVNSVGQIVDIRSTSAITAVWNVTADCNVKRAELQLATSI